MYHPIKTLEDFKHILDTARVIIIDIDDTLLEYNPHTWPKCRDTLPGLKEYLRTLIKQDEKTVLAITARFPEKQVIDFTVEQLASHDIELSKINYEIPEYKWVIKEGILCVGCSYSWQGWGYNIDSHKGRAIKALFDHKIINKTDHVVFIDDQKINIEAVGETCEALSISYDLIHVQAEVY